ncbi:MAG: cytidylate kinase-like family protein [Pirellulales bacterium]|nr:cytidylate kinase-like family protein [Pirellulales bacterium]
MRVLTISREYGAGGGELAWKLADSLGWELLGRELLHEAANIQHVPDAELERLDEQAVTMSDRFRMHPPHQQYLLGLTEAVQRAAEQGNVILVGRGAVHLLAGVEQCLHIRLVAPKAWRVARMVQREGWTTEQGLARCTETDRARVQFHRFFFGEGSDQPAQYDLVINASLMPMENIIKVIKEIVNSHSVSTHVNRVSKPVLTMSRELGAGDKGFAPPLAEQLGLEVIDREILEEQARRLDISMTDLEKIDEKPASLFQRFRPGSVHYRYIETLKQLMQEQAERGNVLIVGRGGFRFLKDISSAFHVRLVAAMPVRIRRVMEYHWVREGVARKLILNSDTQRRSFCQDYFGVDWTSPLEYHMTVNSGRLGSSAIDVVASAAMHHWARPISDA